MMPFLDISEDILGYSEGEKEDLQLLGELFCIKSEPSK